MNNNRKKELLQSAIDNMITILKIKGEPNTPSFSDENKNFTLFLYLLKNKKFYFKLKEYISKGLDLNLIDKNTGYTLLMNAVVNNDIDAAKFLLKHGANPNIKGFKKETALIFAVHQKNLKMVRLLLKNGADPEIKHKKGFNSLQYALKKDQMKCAKILLDNDANVDIRDSKGRTALWYAALDLNMEHVKLLLKYNPDLNKCDHSGISVLIACCFYRRGQNSKNAKELRLKIARKLIKAGADVFYEDKKGRTALSISNDYNYEKLIKFLKKHIAKSNSHRSNS